MALVTGPFTKKFIIHNIILRIEKELIMSGKHYIVLVIFLVGCKTPDIRNIRGFLYMSLGYINRSHFAGIQMISSDRACKVIHLITRILKKNLIANNGVTGIFYCE